MEFGVDLDQTAVNLWQKVTWKLLEHPCHIFYRVVMYFDLFFKWIGAALGDSQSSIYSALFDKPENASAFINISTSFQLVFLLPAGSHTKFPVMEGVEIRDYFHGRFLAVVASLNGGNTLHTFVKMLTSWVQDLGLDVDSGKL